MFINALFQFEEEIGVSKVYFTDTDDIIPILKNHINSEEKLGVDKILPAVKKAYESYHKRIPTSILNKIVADAQAMNPTPLFNYGRLKIIFASQTSVAPPTFVMFCNDPNFAHFSYTRYLENQLRDSFDFAGTPIHIIYRQRQ